MSETKRDAGRIARWSLAIVWSVVFLYLLVVFSPSGTKLASLAGSWSRMLGLPPGTLFKVGHVGGYVLWVFLWCGVIAGGYRKPLPRTSLGWALIVLVAMVTVPEGLQSLNPDRHPTWMDVGFNSVGALIGLVLRLSVTRRGE